MAGKAFIGRREDFDRDAHQVEEEPALWNAGLPAPGRAPRTLAIYRDAASQESPADSRELRRLVAAAVRGAGQRLPSPLERRLRLTLDADLTDVRVHADSASARACDALFANAFAFGQDVYFADGKYAPDTEAGRQLITHEVVHTVQQGRQTARLDDDGTALRISQPSDAHEVAADAIASRPTVASPTTTPHIGRAPAGVIARNPSTGAATSSSSTSAGAAAWDEHIAHWDRESERYTRDLSSTGQNIAVDVTAVERAYATRVWLLLIEETDIPDDAAEADERVKSYADAAKNEAHTIILLNQTMTTPPEYFSAGAFPKTWAERLRTELKLPDELATAVSDRWSKWKEVQKLGAELPPYLFAHGLPVPFEPALTLSEFKLKPGHAALSSSHGIKPYTAKMLEYQKAYGLAFMATQWKGGLSRLASGVERGEKVIDTTTYDQFIFDTTFDFLLYDLLAKANTIDLSDVVAQEYVDMMPFSIAMAEMNAPFAKLEEIAMWGHAEANWQLWLSVGDEKIAGASKTKKMQLAKDWANEWGYFGDAADQTIKQIKENLPETAAYGALFTLAMFIPIVREITLVASAVNAGYQAVKAIDSVYEAWKEVAHAKGVINLQRAAAQASMMSVSGGAQVMAALIKYKAGKAIAKRVPKSGPLRKWTGKSPPSAKKRGMTKAHDKRFGQMAKNGQKIVIVRDSNPAAGKYVGKKGYLPKPEKLKAKSRTKGPNKGLAAVDPRDPRLMAQLKRDKMSYDQYVAKLKKQGYTVGSKREGYIIRDQAKNKFHSDYDLHGVYDKQGNNAYSTKWKKQANEELGGKNQKAGGEMIQHGPHDRWSDRNRDAAGVNRGPQPPATAYLPNGKKVHLKTIEDMKRFYRENGIDWSKIYPEH